MNILIVGAKGQLGQALTAQIRQHRDHSAIALSHKEMDVTDFSQIEMALDQRKPDWVVNASAYNFVDKAEEEKDAAFAVNRDGPANLARAAFRKNVRLIHVSTDYVFDGKSSRPYKESDVPHPLSVYAESKYQGEQAVLSTHPQSYVVRTAWLYHYVGRNFLRTLIGLKDRAQLRVVNDQFGSPTYAPHLAEKLVWFMEQRAPFGLYHMAGAGRASWFDLAKAAFIGIGLKTTIAPIPAAEWPYTAPRPKSTVLATEKGAAFQLPPWEHGVSEFVAHMKRTLYGM